MPGVLPRSMESCPLSIRATSRPEHSWRAAAVHSPREWAAAAPGPHPRRPLTCWLLLAASEARLGPSTGREHPCSCLWHRTGPKRGHRGSRLAPSPRTLASATAPSVAARCHPMSEECKGDPLTASCQERGDLSSSTAWGGDHAAKSLPLPQDSPGPLCVWLSPDP